MQITMSLSADTVATANKQLTQWDYGQTLSLIGVDLPSNYEVHFSTYKTKDALVVNATSSIISIPDEILANVCADKINVYVYVKTSNDGTTVYKGIIRCNMRSKPNDYPVEIWEKVNLWDEVVNGYANAIYDEIVYDGIETFIGTEPIEHTLDRKAFVEVARNLQPKLASGKKTAGITYTVMSDGTIKASGTATASAWIGLPLCNIEVGKRYKFVGTPAISGCSIVAYKKDGSTVIATDSGDGATFTATEDGVYLWLKVVSGATVNNAIFKPMICSNTRVKYNNYISNAGFQLDVLKDEDTVISYNITDDVAEVRTFDGETILWCNYMPYMTLKYAIDTKSYIDRMLTSLLGIDALSNNITDDVVDDTEEVTE